MGESPFFYFEIRSQLTTGDSFVHRDGLEPLVGGYDNDLPMTPRIALIVVYEQSLID